MRFSDVILAYVVIGGVMFGGGAIAWDDAGVAGWFVEDTSTGFEPSDNTTGKAQDVEGSIKNIVGQFAGPLVIVWNFVVAFVSFINWPIVVLASNNAPPVIILILGVPLTAAFYLSLVRLVRTSA